MLTIDTSLLIGKGANRYCYQHPQDANKCIKIGIDQNSPNDKLEKKYYQLLLKRNISWNMLAKYCGEENTDLGKGLVFELIRDFSGQVSNTLEYYTENASQIFSDDLFDALLLLKPYLIEQQIILRNLKPYNLVYQRINKEEGKMVIIDNIGHHNSLFHLTDYIKSLAVKDILKKWNKFESSFIKLSK